MRCLTSPRYAFVIAVFLTSYSVLRGIWFPNLWSYTHYLFNYDNGFVKRGLIGTIVNATNIPFFHTYTFFSILSFITFGISLLLIFNLINKTLQAESIYFNICVWLFSSSLAIVFLSHSVGYFDNLGLLTTLCILNIHTFKYKITVALLFFTLCLFSHEGLFIIFFPVILISLINALKTNNHSIRHASFAKNFHIFRITKTNKWAEQRSAFLCVAIRAIRSQATSVDYQHMIL